MDYEKFEKTNIVERFGYSHEVESDAQEWELALDGIMTIEKKLDEHVFVEDRKSVQAFVQESMKYLEEKGIL